MSFFFSTSLEIIVQHGSCGSEIHFLPGSLEIANFKRIARINETRCNTMQAYLEVVSFVFSGVYIQVQ